MNNLETMSLLGRCLAPGREDLNGLLEERLGSPGMDWKRLLLIASWQFLAPGLSLALKRRGLWGVPPDEILDVLRASELLNRKRNALHNQELLAIIRKLNSVGISPLLLKGAISLLPGQLPEIEGRVLSDLDLLLPEDRVEDALQAIEELGYAFDPDMYLEWYKDYYHLPPLYHPEHKVRLEVHTGLTGPHVKPILDPEQMWCSAQVVEFERVSALIPDNYMRLLHNVVHTRLQDRLHRNFKLEMRQLNDWVQLRDYCNSDVDWRHMWEAFNLHGEAAVLEAYFLAAERFFGQPLPVGIEPSRAALRTDRKMCLAMSSPMWSFLLSDIKIFTRKIVTPAAYVRGFRSWKAARRR